MRRRLETSLGEVGCAPAPGFLGRMESFARLLALWGSKMSLTARPDEPDEIAFHIIDSLGPLLVSNCKVAEYLHDALAPGRQVLDLGSGAGFPGLVLAAAGDAHYTLLESRRKRASFLLVAAAEMGLRNVRVEQSRAKPTELSPAFDLVTARALGMPAEFYLLASKALLKGGMALMYADPSQRLDVGAADKAGLRQLARLSYAVPRGPSKVVARMLVCWRKP
jgi:16S rRNA (guanine527-N7)-methyltransferase